MGNCNYRAEQNEEGQSKSIQYSRHIQSSHVVSSDNEAALPVPLRGWQRRIRAGLESRTQEVQVDVRDEGDVEGAHRQQEVRQLGHQ